MLDTIKNALRNPKFYLYLILGIFILAISGFMSVLWLDTVKGGPMGRGDKKVEFIINPGEGSTEIIRRLKRNKLIRSSYYFQLLLKFTGNARNLKQGIYSLDDSMDAQKILSVLVAGKVKLRSFTVPEGYNNRQIGDLLVKKNIAESRDEFLQAASDKEILEKFKIPATTSEGYLFPDTYWVPYHYKARDIVQLMIRSFIRNLKKIPTAKGFSPEERHKRVILASIVEREAQRDEERPMMAGVFLKRVEKGMRLESCATVQYLFDKPKKRLFEIHLKKESPYNTYLHSGYPPGPISNPGFASLKAAYEPIDSGNLFFLLKPDGSHYFSQTLTEHIKAKKKYIDSKYK
ncbi:MAG: endolytic transglycosylase MltG [Leptospiraceae bacterium]|nr:endolytic transglycosylase MltG [Leptospiraceae bacterium]MCP5498548.1 endolytic transglycosylase MltG [Leptospiraceae bacterium]